jgi:hypothetical protein
MDGQHRDEVADLPSLMSWTRVDEAHVGEGRELAASRNEAEAVALAEQLTTQPLGQPRSRLRRTYGLRPKPAKHHRPARSTRSTTKVAPEPSFGATAVGGSSAEGLAGAVLTPSMSKAESSSPWTCHSGRAGPHPMPQAPARLRSVAPKALDWGSPGGRVDAWDASSTAPRTAPEPTPRRDGAGRPSPASGGCAVDAEKRRAGQPGAWHGRRTPGHGWRAWRWWPPGRSSALRCRWVVGACAAGRPGSPAWRWAGRR